MSQDTGRRPDPLTGEVRFKVPLPVLIPIVAVVVIAALTVGFSRVLLSIPKEAATAIAVATSANILIACAVVALRPRMSQTRLIEMSLVVLYPVIIGIVIAQLGIGEEEAAAEAPAPAEAPAGDLVAEDVQFNKDEITLPAGEETPFEFVNEDQLQHNVAIYTDQADADAQENPLFQGELITATTTTYQIDPLEKGEYVFQCDVHPAMTGSVIVE